MKKKTSGKHVITAIISLVACVAVLLGTTYAWFNADATVSVNEIVAGKLDVDLVDSTGASLVGTTLKFQKAASASSERLLWEPDCEYSLQPIYIENSGELALTYKVEVTGIDGDDALLDYIDWKVKVGTEEIDLDTYEATLTAGSTSTAAITIVGHMSQDAGNELMGASASGISITVYAKQAAVESDSNGNTYDADAVYSTEAA